MGGCNSLVKKLCCRTCKPPPKQPDCKDSDQKFTVDSKEYTCKDAVTNLKCKKGLVRKNCCKSCRGVPSVNTRKPGVCKGDKKDYDCPLNLGSDGCTDPVKR